jgi:fermentation-respiration switch protein FrsA (DUF1100 family)
VASHPSSSEISAAIASTRPARGRSWPWKLVVVAVLLAEVLTFCYSAVSLIMATQLAYVPQVPILKTPAALGLSYRDVRFPSREDHLLLRGWFIPGVLPDGQLTARRTIIVVHGTRANRTDPSIGLLDLTGQLARHGLAVLAFDLRGSGESPPAPLSFGYFEQRDVLGAVDFLRSGALPYPELGRPAAIGGWGGSMGAASLLLAAAREPALRAIVSDSAYAEIISVLQRQIPQVSGFPAFFTPGALLAARAMYGVDYYAVRPVDVVASLAPRPLFFIHGASDHLIPPANLTALVNAARSAPGAQVQSWLVPGADHGQAFHVAGAEYVNRVVAFFTSNLPGGAADAAKAA